MSPKWGFKNIPSLMGKVAIVTGSTSGVGYETAYSLAENGAHVIIASRNYAKALLAVDKLKGELWDADVTYIPLDLTSLDSIADFAQEFGQKYEKLDILVNNAGVLAVPKRTLTEDGFELQFGTNYLGHYALTARLVQYLASCVGMARVVNLASGYSRKGHLNFNDLMSEKKYNPWKAYANSKLANLLFTKELQRRSDAYGWGIIAVAATPGFARTNLFSNGPGADSCVNRASSSCCGTCWGQSAAFGALPVLYAATSDDIQPGGFYGPQSCCGLKGSPGEVNFPKQCNNKQLAVELWEVSSKLTKLSWPDQINLVGSEDAKAGAGETLNIPKH